MFSYLEERTPAEVEAGYALACQSLPQTDTVTVDFDS